MPTKKYDTFEYDIRMVEYNDYYPSNDLKCVFIINGKDILDIIKEELNGCSYHHTNARTLWADDLGDDPYEPGRIHPLICSCDELGCANIAAHITETNESVIWDRFYESHSMYEEDETTKYLDLSFEFEINDYKRKIKEIINLALLM